MGGDKEKMIAVGLVWGATNALMRRGAVLWDEALQHRRRRQHQVAAGSNRSLLTRAASATGDFAKLLLIWQYTVPFALNLSASAAFFAALSRSPISVAVPVTNATTFAATAVFGALLGEKTRPGFALGGMALIVVGVWLCISQPISLKSNGYEA